jgi:hypothetical protein
MTLQDAFDNGFAARMAGKRLGQAGPGEAWHGPAGTAWPGRHGMARRVEARNGEMRHGRARQGLARPAEPDRREAGHLPRVRSLQI